jgi:hypothetical protein
MGLYPADWGYYATNNRTDTSQSVALRTKGQRSAADAAAAETGRRVCG